MKKNLNNEVDDRWRKKGHFHNIPERIPRACHACQGYGYNEAVDGTPIECEACKGGGTIYD